jgi:hypothetical protein
MSEHSRRQGELCAKYLDTSEFEARALKVAEEICILRWASITDLYRQEVSARRRFCRREWDEDARDRLQALVMTFLGGGYRLREGSATSGFLGLAEPTVRDMTYSHELPLTKVGVRGVRYRLIDLIEIE